MAKFIEHVYRAVVSMRRNLLNEKLSLLYRTKYLPKSLEVNERGLQQLYNEEHGTNLSVEEAFLAYQEERKKRYGNKIHERTR